MALLNFNVLLNIMEVADRKIMVIACFLLIVIIYFFSILDKNK